MPYHPIVDPVVLRLVFSGALTSSEVTRALQLGSGLAQNSAVPMLIDLQRVTNRIAMLELLEAIDASLGSLRSVRHALLIRPDTPSHDTSVDWKLLASNRALHVEAFDDEASAIAWLCRAVRD